MSGFLSGLGLDNVDETGAVPDGIYPGFVTQSSLITKRDDTTAWKITYRVLDEFPNAPGAEQDEWWNNLDNMSAKAKGFLKRRVLMLGVPAADIDRIQPETLVGTAVWFKVYTNKNGYKALGDIKLRNPKHVSAEDYLKDPAFNESIGGYPNAGTPTVSAGSVAGPVVGGSVVDGL